MNSFNVNTEQTGQVHTPKQKLIIDIQPNINKNGKKYLRYG